MDRDERDGSALPGGPFVELGAAHEGGVYGLVATPDAVVSGGGEGLLMVRDREGALRQPAIAMPDHAGVLCLALSPDAHSVLAGTMNGVALVDLATGRARAVDGPTGWVRSVAWESPGWAAVGDDHKLWVARAAGAPEVVRDLGQQLHLVLLPALDPACALTRDAMRRFVLSPLDGGPPRWERDDFEADSVTVAALRDHHLAVAGEVGPIRVLDVRTGTTSSEVASPEEVTALAWSGDHLVAADRDLRLRYFSPGQQWHCERTQRPGHRSWINVIVATSGSEPHRPEILTGGDDGLVLRGCPGSLDRPHRDH